MRRIEETGLFTCLREKTWTELTDEEIDRMAGEFMDAVRKGCDEREDYGVAMRFLDDVSGRLGYWKSCQESTSDGRQEGRIFSVVDTVRQLVDREIGLKRDRKEHPEWFKKEEKGVEGVGVVFQGGNGHGKMPVMEIVLGLYLTGMLRLPTGEAAGLIDAVRWGERWFGVELPNHRSLKRNFFARKKGLTVFLDRMREAIMEEAERLSK